MKTIPSVDPPTRCSPAAPLRVRPERRQGAHTFRAQSALAAVADSEIASKPDSNPVADREALASRPRPPSQTAKRLPRLTWHGAHASDAPPGCLGRHSKPFGRCLG